MDEITHEFELNLKLMATFDLDQELGKSLLATENAIEEKKEEIISSIIKHIKGLGLDYEMIKNY